jgi:hypothetical protein
VCAPRNWNMRFLRPCNDAPEGSVRQEGALVDALLLGDLPHHGLLADGGKVHRLGGHGFRLTHLSG